MTPLLSAELLKARTTRALWIAVPVVLVLAAAIPVISGGLAGSGDVPALSSKTLLDFVRAPVQLAGAAVLLVGLLSAAGEFRHRTVFLTRLAEPKPARVLGAKLAATALVGLLVGLVVDVITVITGAAVLHAHDIPIQVSSYGVPRILVIVPIVVAAYGVIGVAVGTLIRSTAGAVGATLVWAFIIEGVLPVLTGSPHLADRLPSGAFRAVLHTHATGSGPSPATAAALLAAYAVGLIAVAAVLDRTREL
jgi:hypothetical protein